MRGSAIHCWLALPGTALPGTVLAGIVLPSLVLAGLVLTRPVLASEPTVKIADRHVAIVVDTSTSMRGNDKQRYTMQLSQIVSDLLDAGDQLTVVRMGSGRCSAAASSSLALRLDATDRDDFKRRLAAHTRFDTGTHYAAAIRTAIEVLGHDETTQRMLLILADSGGLGRCREVLTRDLSTLHNSGATIAAVNLGSSSGAFDSNPAFDLTTAALDAEEMVRAVAEIYQRFLGAKKVQTGRVNKVIEVEIAPFVDEAFLVVAADGPALELQPADGNPPATAIDFDHRGGGQTVGVDHQTRVYRIVRLSRPAPGRFRFNVPGLVDSAGWMLLQDSSLAVRLVSSTTIPQGTVTPLEVELYDRSTGERVADASSIQGLEVTLEVDGRPMSFRDDGNGADRRAGDGILTAEATFEGVGQRRIPIRIGSDFLDRSLALDIDIVDAAWGMRVTTPETSAVSQPVTLSVVLEPIGASQSLTPVERVDVLTGGPPVELRDDGLGADERPGDRIYSGSWTPPNMGTFSLDYVPRGGSIAPQVSQSLEAIGSLDLESGTAVNLGVVGSRSEALGRLDMNNTTVHGVYEVEVSSRFELERSILEIDIGNGWETFDATPRTLQLVQSGDNSWPLRLRVGACPPGREAAEVSEIFVSAVGADGESEQIMIPLRVEVRSDSWLKCWWPILAMCFGIAAGGTAIYGFWSPSRFPPRLGLVLSPEEDLAEGFFHPIRAQRGSSSGFYRDARIYIHPDFRLSSHARGAVARLRADGQQVRIQPAEGIAVWRQTSDEEWQVLPQEEMTARFGTVYRDALETLFFELRNG